MREDAPEVVPAVAETAASIAEMDVRGAATIADAAAAALAAQAERSGAETPEAFRAGLRLAARTLSETRPTAVSLPNALRYVMRGTRGESVAELRASTVARAEAFRADLAAAREQLGRVGANRIRDGDVVMTHCHSTDALACVEHALADGKEIEAIVKETRPRNQGHITARQLREWGVPVTLIVDGAARRYLGDADHVLVGADSIAADGSVVNKIGTGGLAVCARERGVPVMVAAQTVKLHPDTMTGHSVEIEMRDEREVLAEDARAELEAADRAADNRSAGDLSGADEPAESGTSAGQPAGSSPNGGDRRVGGEVDDDGPTDGAGLTVENPAFDVTPPRYVDAIVTERGQFPPESIVVLMRELFGESIEDPWEESASTDA